MNSVVRLVLGSILLLAYSSSIRSSLVNIFAISDLDDVYDEYCVLNRIENTITTVPDSVPVAT